VAGLAESLEIRRHVRASVLLGEDVVDLGGRLVVAFLADWIAVEDEPPEAAPASRVALLLDRGAR